MLLLLRLLHGFFFFTIVTGPRRSLSLKLSDTRVYAPQIRARLGTTAHFCVVVALNCCTESREATRSRRSRSSGSSAGSTFTTSWRVPLMQLRRFCRTAFVRFKPPVATLVSSLPVAFAACGWTVFASATFSLAARSLVGRDNLLEELDLQGDLSREDEALKGDLTGDIGHLRRSCLLILIFWTAAMATSANALPANLSDRLFLDPARTGYHCQQPRFTLSVLFDGGDLRRERAHQSGESPRD